MPNPDELVRLLDAYDAWELEEKKKNDWVGLGLRVLPPVATGVGMAALNVGTGGGALATLPAQLGAMAGASGLGETAAQAYEKWRFGDEMRPADIATQTVIGGVPLGRMNTLASAVGKSALLGASQPVVRRAFEGEGLPTAGEVVGGALGGGAFGAAGHVVLNPLMRLLSGRVAGRPAAPKAPSAPVPPAVTAPPPPEQVLAAFDAAQAGTVAGTGAGLSGAGRPSPPPAAAPAVAPTPPPVPPTPAGAEASTIDPGITDDQLRGIARALAGKAKAGTSTEADNVTFQSILRELNRRHPRGGAFPAAQERRGREPFPFFKDIYNAEAATPAPAAPVAAPPTVPAAPPTPPPIARPAPAAPPTPPAAPPASATAAPKGFPQLPPATDVTVDVTDNGLMFRYRDRTGREVARATRYPNDTPELGKTIYETNRAGEASTNGFRPTPEGGAVPPPAAAAPTVAPAPPVPAPPAMRELQEALEGIRADLAANREVIGRSGENLSELEDLHRLLGTLSSQVGDLTGRPGVDENARLGLAALADRLTAGVQRSIQGHTSAARRNAAVLQAAPPAADVPATPAPAAPVPPVAPAAPAIAPPAEMTVTRGIDARTFPLMGEIGISRITEGIRNGRPVFMVYGKSGTPQGVVPTNGQTLEQYVQSLVAEANVPPAAPSFSVGDLRRRLGLGYRYDVEGQPIRSVADLDRFIAGRGLTGETITNWQETGRPATPVRQTVQVRHLSTTRSDADAEQWLSEGNELVGWNDERIRTVGEYRANQKAAKAVEGPAGKRAAAAPVAGAAQTLAPTAAAPAPPAPPRVPRSPKGGESTQEFVNRRATEIASRAVQTELDALPDTLADDAKATEASMRVIERLGFYMDQAKAEGGALPSKAKILAALTEGDPNAVPDDADAFVRGLIQQVSEIRRATPPVTPQPAAGAPTPPAPPVPSGPAGAAPGPRLRKATGEVVSAAPSATIPPPPATTPPAGPIAPPAGAQRALRAGETQVGTFILRPAGQTKAGFVKFDLEQGGVADLGELFRSGRGWRASAGALKATGATQQEALANLDALLHGAPNPLAPSPAGRAPTGEAGFATPQVLAPLAGAGVGALAGGAADEEHPVRGALAGAAAGAALGYGLTRGRRLPPSVPVGEVTAPRAPVTQAPPPVSAPPPPPAAPLPPGQRPTGPRVETLGRLFTPKPTPAAAPPPGQIPAERRIHHSLDPLVEDPELREVMGEHLDDIFTRTNAFTAARGGVISDARVRKLAEAIVVPVNQKLPPRHQLSTEQIAAYASAFDGSLREAKRLATRIKAGEGSDADTIEFGRRMADVENLWSTLYASTAEQARALRYRQVLNNILPGEFNEVVRVMRSGKKSITALVDSLAELPLDDPERMALYLRSRKHRSVTEKAVGYYINNILSGVLTQERNILGNAAALVDRLITKGAAGAVDNILHPDLRSVRTGELKHDLLGMVSGWNAAVRDAAYTLQHGFSVARIKEASSVQGMLGESVLEFEHAEFAGGGKNPLNWPSRLLDAADRFFYQLNKSAELHGLTYTRALNEAEAAGRPNDWSWIANRMTALRAEPDLALAQAARQSALRGVYREKVPAAIAGLQLMKQKVPALNLLIPFVRMPYNLIKQGMEHTPAGLVMKQGTSQRIYESLIKGAAEGEERDVALAVGRMVAGTALLTPLAYYASTGRISGSGPSDPNKRAALMRTGWRPNSVNLPLSDKLAAKLGASKSADGTYWVQYQLFQPISIPMMAVANGFELAREGRGPVDDPKAAEKWAADVSMRFTKSILSQSFLSGLSNFMEAVNDPDRWAKNFLGGTAAGFVPLSGALSTVQRALDPTLRRTETAPEVFQSRMPGLSEQLPARIDVFGRPIEREESAFNVLSPVRSREDWIDQELNRLGISLAAPLSRLEVQLGEGATRRLTGDQQREVLQRAIGTGKRAALVTLLQSPGYRRLPDWAKRDAIEDYLRGASRAVTTRARSALWHDRPLDLDRLLTARQRALAEP